MYFQELEIGEELYEFLQDMAKEEFDAAIAEINTEYDNRCFSAKEWEVEYAA